MGTKRVYHVDNTVVGIPRQPVRPYDHQDPVVIEVAGEHDIVLGAEDSCQLEAGSLGGGGAVPEVCKHIRPKDRPVGVTRNPVRKSAKEEVHD